MFHSKKRARVDDDANAAVNRVVEPDINSDNLDDDGVDVDAAGAYVPVALPPGTATSAKEEIVM
jgi:hypothetical protein